MLSENKQSFVLHDKITFTLAHEYVLIDGRLQKTVFTVSATALAFLTQRIRLENGRVIYFRDLE